MTKSNGLISENVTRVELSHSVSAGIMWGAIGSDMVPIYEEHQARLERNYSIAAWYELEAMERAMVIAIRRIDNAARNLQSEAEIADAKRNANKGKR